MSVKRFLLRYDPPGLGLQVGGQGEPTMHHVDLPELSQVKSFKDILDTVDDLLQKHNSLLSHERHSSALQKLLGRLYQIEVGAGETKATERQVSAGSNLRQGQQVVMVRASALHAHYGEVGTLTKVNADKDKYEVTISGDGESGQEPTVELVKVKGADSVAPVDPAGGPLVAGALAVLRGLRSHGELNGCLVRVVECEEGGRRFAVQVSEGGQVLRVKTENLVVVDAQGRSLPLEAIAIAATPLRKRAPSLRAATIPEGEALLGAGPVRQGEVVRLHGLRSAQQYNGQTGTVLKVDQEKHRYEVRLQDGSVKSIRADNATVGREE